MFNLHSVHFFSNDQNYKIWWIIIIEILLPLTNNNPNCHRTRHAPSNLSIPYPSLFYLFCLFPPSLRSLHWLDCVTQEVRLSTGEYTYVYNHNTPHAFYRDELFIAIFPDHLPHTLLFSIHRPTILTYST